MSQKSILSLWLFILHLRAGASGAEELNGVLGESVTFQLKTNLSFVSIFWSKIVGSKSENISVVAFGEPPGLLVPLPSFQKRVNISKDCRELHLSQLEKEDTGRYTAGIVLQSRETVDESFDLRVFNLAEASGTEEVSGIQEETVTFKVRKTPPYKKTIWSKIDSNQTIHIAVVLYGEPCGLLVTLPAFQKRITSQNRMVVDESFDLRVFSKYPSHGREFLTSRFAQGDVHRTFVRDSWLTDLHS
ncbi:uncharacterized protein LOC131186840 [Ahaetulla prasina]|uniref:uncharacterized protein LOC131186840 n=1 Tax=Ahaetulla prasina TaxID=499056 RepID=UPI0026479DD7|nr:uncharacterized protein LOC131186840 [Ahaetulla prasina]